MDLSQEFNQEEACDLVLHLDAKSDCRKRPRSPSPHSLSFFVHRVVLRQSPYFKAMLLRWRPTAADSNAAAPSETSPARPELLLHVDHEDELVAFELLLKCMYKAGLPEEAQKSGQSRLLLQVYRLADRYEVPGSCMEPIVAALSALKAEDVDLAMLSEAYSMLAGLQEAPPLANLMAACQQRLLALFGNVPAVIVSEELRQQFCALPQAAVLAWLKADDLKVHSESCVVLLLSAWVHSTEAHPACSPQQLEQLATNVRMQHVSSVYLHSVLPDLAWIRDNCGGKIKLLRALQLQRSGQWPVDSLSQWSGPTAWILKQRTGTVRSSGVVTLKLGPQQLHKLEEQQYILSDGNAYQNGMFFRLRVERNMATKAQIVRLMWQRLKIRRYKLDLMDTTMAGRRPGQRRPLLLSAEQTEKFLLARQHHVAEIEIWEQQIEKREPGFLIQQPQLDTAHSFANLQEAESAVPSLTGCTMLGLHVQVDAAAMEAALGSWEKDTPCTFDAELSAGSKKRCLRAISSSLCQRAGYDDFLECSCKTLQETIAPFLEQDCLALKVCVYT